ncbi:MAG TPA: caspase family protein, partial [Ktedonobacteraceae bacterium]
MSNTNASDITEKGRRIALVIGVNEAPNSHLVPLSHAAADAEAVAEVLQQHCNFELLEPPLVNEQATSDRVKDAVRRLARNRSADDFLLLYFSGHGQPMFIEAERRDIYLATNNFSEIDVEEDEATHFSMRW